MEKVANMMEGKTEDKLFNFRPALFAAIFLIFGMVFSYYRVTIDISVWWAALPAGCLFLSLFFCESFRSLGKRMAVSLAMLLFFGGGFLAFRAQIDDFTDCKAYNGEFLVIGTVENRRDKGDYYQFTLRDVYVGEERTKGRLNAYLPTTIAREIVVSDRIVIRGEVTTNTEIMAEYGFRGNDISKKLCYTIKSETFTKARKSSNFLLLVRARMEEVLYAGMEEMPASLTLALLTGDTSGVDEDLDANMRYGGISHSFAVSGLNVGALFLLCVFLFSKTPLCRTPKVLRLLLLIGILTFYSGICCFTASVVRAAVMCVVAYFFKLLGTGSDPLNGLGIAAIFILLLCPAELFGVGFQLSFLACLGLFLLTNRIGQVFDELYFAFRKLFPRKYTKEEQKLLADGDTLPPTIGEGIRRWVTTLLSASIGAQITTAPALLIHFGYLSGWSLLLNFVFVPFTDGIFTILLVMVAIACFLPIGYSAGLLYLPSVLWSAAMLVFELVDFSSFAIKGMQISLLFCVCYYGGVTFLSDKWNISKGLRRTLSLLLWIACVAILLFDGGIWT